MFKTAPEHGSGRRAFISWSLVILATVIPVGLLVVSVSQGDALSDTARRRSPRCSACRW